MALQRLGAALVSFKSRFGDAIRRTLQDKLEDIVFLEDYGGKDDGVTDNSLAFRKAFAAGKNKIHLRGSGIYAMKTRDIELPEKYEIIGNAKKPEIKYLGNDASFTMFTLTGTGPLANQWKNGGIFRDCIIASDVQINWMVCRHVQNLDYDRVFFYNAATLMNNYHYVNFFRCERWGSPFLGRADLNTEKFISEAPKFVTCFSSNSIIDVWDTADLAITDCTMFAGECAVRVKATLTSPDPGDRRVGFPVHITGSVFDAVQGQAWDLQDIAYSTITGNLVSAGRDHNTHGAYIKGAVSNTITGNSFTYCGNYGMVIENGEQNCVTGNNYNGNKVGGLGFINCKDTAVTGGSMGTSYVRGGFYEQPIGFSDIASNSTGITLTGVAFGRDMANTVYLDTQSGTNNRILGCVGVPDSSNRGSTAQRPTNPYYGMEYFDLTLGIPIYWNAVASSWQNALGNNV